MRRISQTFGENLPIRRNSVEGQSSVNSSANSSLSSSSEHQKDFVSDYSSLSDINVIVNANNDYQEAPFLVDKKEGPYQNVIEVQKQIGEGQKK